MNGLKSVLAIALGVAALGAFPSEAKASSNPQAIVMNSFNLRDFHLRSEIGRELWHLHISSGMANDLSNQLNSVRRQEQSAIAAGGLDDSRIAQFNGAYDGIENELDACR
ncbi:MAG TPA: hypothetical protein V6D22_23240 [Candidatus Obscuribacterales bacterium]